MVETRRSRRKTRHDDVEFQELPMVPTKRSSRRKKRSSSESKPDDHSSVESDVTPIKFGAGRKYLPQTLEDDFVSDRKKKQSPSSLEVIVETENEEPAPKGDEAKNENYDEIPVIHDAPPDGSDGGADKDTQSPKLHKTTTTTVEAKSNSPKSPPRAKRGRSKSPVRSKSPTRLDAQVQETNRETEIPGTQTPPLTGKSSSPARFSRTNKATIENEGRSEDVDTDVPLEREISRSPLPSADRTAKTATGEKEESAETVTSPKRGRSKSPVRSSQKASTTDTEKDGRPSEIVTPSRGERSKSPVRTDRKPRVTNLEKDKHIEKTRTPGRERSESPHRVDQTATVASTKTQDSKDLTERNSPPKMGGPKSPVRSQTSKMNVVVPISTTELEKEVPTEESPRRGKSAPRLRTPVKSGAKEIASNPENEVVAEDSLSENKTTESGTKAPKSPRSHKSPKSTETNLAAKAESGSSSTLVEPTESPERKPKDASQKDSASKSKSSSKTEKERLVLKVLPKKSKQQKKSKATRNELTSLIPGYTATLQLDSSSLDNQKLDLESLRKRALVTDKTTAAFVKGSVANQKQIREVLTVKPGGTVVNAFKKGNKPEPVNHAGDKWFGMVPTPLTDEVKRDLHVIRNRGFLDPKRFYKSSDKESKYVQIGTVVEGSAEYYSARLTKKERRSNFTAEVMADPSTADYAKRKFRTMQQEKNAKVQSQRPKKKKAKRMHA